MSDFRRFVEDRRLVRTKIDRKMILKEIKGAAADRSKVPTKEAKMAKAEACAIVNHEII